MDRDIKAQGEPGDGHNNFSADHIADKRHVFVLVLPLCGSNGQSGLCMSRKSYVLYDELWDNENTIYIRR